MTKVIWVIGAGASIGHSEGKFPAINDFFSVAKDLGVTADNKNRIKNKYKSLNDYVSNMFGKSIIDKKDKINIEQLMTMVEIEIIERYSSYNVELRESILEIIVKTLTNLSQKIENKISQYNVFAQNINEEDTIISFNWDILLDNVLGRKKYLIKDGEKQGQYFNFFHQISAFGEGTLGKLTIAPPYFEYSNKKGYYLKLHGSIDWFTCMNEGCRAFGKTFPTEFPGKELRCSECHSQMRTTIIPPVLHKNFREYPAIRKIWNTAIREVKSADEAIIWGYSFPPTDYYSSWLFKQFSLTSKKVSVINPENLYRQNPPAWGSKFIRNIGDIFRYSNKSYLWDFYEDFNDYIKGITINKKYSLRQLDGFKNKQEVRKIS